jgi:hypothetical protein
MPPFRNFRESAASGRGEIRVAVIAGELIYANVRLRLTANRTYGLLNVNHNPLNFTLISFSIDRVNTITEQRNYNSSTNATIDKR